MCVCVCVCACGGDPPFSRTENYGDISVGVTDHTFWWVCAWSGNRLPREFLDRRHMTAFLFANQTDHFRHVLSTVEKLQGKAISTTTHIHFTKGRGLVWLNVIKILSVSFECEKGPFGSRDILCHELSCVSPYAGVCMYVYVVVWFTVGPTFGGGLSVNVK